jgi:hypothetical protein
MYDRCVHVSIAAASISIVAMTAAPAPASAQPTYPPISDTDYAIDLYHGGALGSIRIVGMGGAAVAIAEGSAGTLVNPAAVAVRTSTSTEKWDWDFHVDWLNTVKAADWDNNGIDGGDGSGVAIITGGLAGNYHDWGLAATVTTITTDVVGANDLNAQALQAKMALARAFAAEAITVGAGVRVGSFSLRSRSASAGDRSLFELSGGGLEVGAVWRPPLGDLRVGASAALPISGTQVSITCSVNCGGYAPSELPERVEVPWHVIAGAAYRFAPTRWNQWVGGHFRDERSLTLAADALITGAVRNGYGLEAFGDMQLQPSGRNVVVGIRAGAEYEWLPGRLRLRGGGYWEPSRFDGISGRAHITFGIEVRALEFDLWGRHRGRISTTADLARSYQNVGLSIGFWH